MIKELITNISVLLQQDNKKGEFARFAIVGVIAAISKSDIKKKRRFCRRSYCQLLYAYSLVTVLSVDWDA